MSAQPIEPPDTRARGTRRARMEKQLGLPPRPGKRQLDPDTGWMEQAACGRPEVPQQDREAFVTIERQADAWPLVARYCSRCPVARECLQDARAVHSSGLSGGYALDDGHLAPDRRGEPFHDADAWVPPWEREDDEEWQATPEEVDLVELARDGITAAQAAVALLGAAGAKGRTEIGRRRLTALERDGHLRKEPAVIGPDGHPTRWWAAPASSPAGRRGQRWQPKRHRRREVPCNPNVM